MMPLSLPGDDSYLRTLEELNDPTLNRAGVLGVDLSDGQRAEVLAGNFRELAVWICVGCWDGSLPTHLRIPRKGATRKQLRTDAGWVWVDIGIDLVHEDEPVKSRHECTYSNFPREQRQEIYRTALELGKLPTLNANRKGRWEEVKLRVPESVYTRWEKGQGVGAGAPVSDMFDAAEQQRIMEDIERARLRRHGDTEPPEPPELAVEPELGPATGPAGRLGARNSRHPHLPDGRDPYRPEVRADGGPGREPAGLAGRRRGDVRRDKGSRKRRR